MPALHLIVRRARRRLAIVRRRQRLLPICESHKVRVPRLLSSKQARPASVVRSFHACRVSLAILLRNELALIRGLEQALLVLLRRLLLLLLSLEVDLREALLEVLKVVVVRIVGCLRLAITDQLLAHCAEFHLGRGLHSALATVLVARLVDLTSSDVLLTEGMSVRLSSSRKERAAESVRALRLFKYLARVARYRVRVDGEGVCLRADVGLVHSIVASLLSSWSFCCRGRVAFADAERLVVVACPRIVRPELATLV